MQREFSAGGVLVRRLAGRWMLAAIRPGGRPRGLWALPKGRIDPGERAEETALREVAEETGAHGRSLGKLGDIRYVFTWDGERIFKIVSFFLIRYEGGRLGDVPEEFRHEIVDRLVLNLINLGKIGSARESEQVGILRGSPESDEFSLGRSQSLSFQQ